MARAWVELMKRLGYSRFSAQGGAWGGFVTNSMAQQAPPELTRRRSFTGTSYATDDGRTLAGLRHEYQQVA
jgi:hypothetical protein